MSRGAYRWLLLALVACSPPACSLFGDGEEARDAAATADAADRDAEAAAEEPGVPEGVESVGNLWLIRAQVPAFDRLKAGSRQLAHSHWRAARAADGVLYRQLGGELARVRRMLAGVLSGGERLPGGMRAGLESYSARFFANHGSLDSCSGSKFTPRFIPGQLAAAAQGAMEQGADIGLADLPDMDLGASRLQELEALMKLVRPWIFDRSFVPARPAPDAGVADEDAGLRAADLAPVIAPLRSSLALGEGAEQVWAGAVIEALEKRDPLAAAAVKLPDEPASGVRTIIGSVPVEGDPQGLESAFAGLVTVADRYAEKALIELGRRAVELDRSVAEEVGAPKTAGRVQSTKVHFAQALIATGWYGPILRDRDGCGFTPVVREPDGGGLIVLTNLAEAADRALAGPIARALGAEGEVAARRAKCGFRSRLAMIALREIVGRGTDGTEKRPLEFLQNRLGEYRLVVDELRADLTALYLVYSPEVRELGLIADDEYARTAYDEYVDRALAQLVPHPHGAALDRPQMQAVQIIVRSLIAKRAVVEERGETGLTLAVADYKEMRKAVGELLAAVRTIRHSGQGERAAELVKGMGGAPPAGWSESAKDSWRSAGLPAVVGFVYPPLEVRRQGRQRLADVEVGASESFLDAQISSIDEARK
jgi:dipeptidyl-peptidase-3